MKRFVALVLLAACAIEEDPGLSTDEAALAPQWHLSWEIESGSLAGATRMADVSRASGGAYLSFAAGGYARFFPNIEGSTGFYVWVRAKALSTVE